MSSTSGVKSKAEPLYVPTDIAPATHASDKPLRELRISRRIRN